MTWEMNSKQNYLLFFCSELLPTRKVFKVTVRNATPFSTTQFEAKKRSFSIDGAKLR